jgi:hypothetical protein
MDTAKADPGSVRSQIFIVRDDLKFSSSSGGAKANRSGFIAIRRGMTLLKELLNTITEQGL